jgi:hypothetical protein
MRKFVTAAATAFALVLGLSAPAFADQSNYPYQGPRPGQNYNDQYDGQFGGQYDDRNEQRFNDRRYRDYNFDRHNGNFDRWERGWNHDRRFDQQYRYGKPMSLRKLARALAYQGFYRARGFQQARWGHGWRAYAFDRNGRPVMVRVNPYNGRVIDVRYI